MKNKKKIIPNQSKNNNKLKSSSKNGENKMKTNKNPTEISGGVNNDDKIWQDPRFSHLVRDPRFKHIHKQTKKTKIDNRFNLMFNDEKFKVTYTSDKYGRPVKKSSSEDLKKYYHIEDKDEEDGDNEVDDAADDSDSDSGKEEEEEQKLEAAAISKDDNENDKLKFDGDSDDDDGVKEIPSSLREKLKDLSIDYARGEATLLTDDSSDDESSSDEDGGDAGVFIEHVWGELDVDAPKTDESTRRLAVCNMDWDRIRSVDIMMLCHSFLPAGGVILSVTIYPSEYGKERMATEEVKGPQELTEMKKKTIKIKSDIVDSDFDDDVDEEDDKDDDNNDNNSENSDDSSTSEIADQPQITEEDEGSDFNMEKLRQYQLNRLKYYYAVIECNNVNTADKIYAECDGLEYESTATKLDLRFIPDDMTFDDEPKDQCTELPDMSKYKPRIFTTTALQQAKVELTWDENDVERKELNDKLMAGKLNEVDDYELRKYVAYSSEEEEDEDENGTEDKEINEKDDELLSENEASEDNDEKIEIKSKNTKKKSSIDKYKDLLNEINEKEKIKKNNQIEMEFSWGIGSKSIKSDIGDIKKEDTDDETTNNNKNKPEITHFEKILELKQEKKKARKEKQKKLRKKYKNGGNNSDDDDDNDDEASDDGGDSDESDMPDGIDMNDSYFAEEFANGEFQPTKSKKLSSNKKNNKKNLNSNDAENELNKKEAELMLLLEDQQRPGGSGVGNIQNVKSHFSLKKIQEQENESKTKKRKKLKRTEREAEKKLLNNDDDFQINTADERFAGVFNRHIFNIDQTNPNFKNTKGVEAFIKEKLKRKPNDDGDINEDNAVDNSNVKKLKKNIELNLLVNSIKRKVDKI